MQDKRAYRLKEEAEAQALVTELTGNGAARPSLTEQLKIAERLEQAEAYGKPRRVWVDDGHVFVEGHDGTVVSMTPEVAIELGRLIGDAGTESLVNKVLDRDGVTEISV